MEQQVEDALAQLAAVNETTIRFAGPRYTPGLNPDAPNIEIDYLVDAFDALSLADGWQERIGALGGAIEKAMEHQVDRLERLFRRRKASPAQLLAKAQELRALRDPTEIRQAASLLRRDCNYVAERLKHEVSALWSQIGGFSETQRQDRERVEHAARALGNVRSEVQELLGYLDGKPGQLLRTDRGLLLLGSWGTGKTHLLCDVARQRLNAGAPALVVMANTLPSNGSLIDSIAGASEFAGSGTELLEKLNRLGETTGARSLLMIDAINEADREVWRQQLARLTTTVSRWPNVALVVSCRRPFDEAIVTDPAAKHLVSVEHFGFQDQEFDAQLEYFRFYDLPAPTIPLLTPEFSRPLFLKILCESLRDLSKRSQRQKLREVASGQKGMTYVLEYYTKKVGATIEHDLGLDSGACWRVLKGTRADGGLAGAMADQGSDWLSTGDTRSVLQASLSLQEQQAADLLRRLLHDGLLAEQRHWRNGQTIDGVQFAYQRFGDHLIARHLLEAHLVTGSEPAVKRCFYANRPLGQIFQVDRMRTTFREPGIASAIMLEFPERMKRASLPRELIDYLPQRARFVAPIKDAFLEGLYWRPADTFTDRTDWMVVYLLTRADEYTRNETLEVLVGLATRPTHPYSAERLAKYLAQQPMAERDVKWSEYLRVCDEQSNVHRILAWAERSTEVSEAVLRNEIRLLSLFLTTTDRPLRDRATRALVLRGSSRPDVLFDEVLGSLGFNDPYVPERMLAAAYGVAMRLWADPHGEPLRGAIVPFARSLMREMFVANAPHATKHVLRRGYALGVIALARRISPVAIATQQVPLLRVPFAQIPSPFVAPDQVREADVKDSLNAMHMDFANYTLGRLFKDRANYDDKHPGYQEVRRQIARRMSDLGYSASTFLELDRTITQRQPMSRQSDGGKTDRYGKKYSWIAYYEMYGVCNDLDLLAEHRSTERIVDADVDPSFPSQPTEWTPPLPDLFADAPVEHSAWLTNGPTPDYGDLLVRDEVDSVSGGPWVLLNGFIQRTGTNNRETFTFLRGVFIQRANIAKVKRDTMALDYLGNSRIPDPGEDYYTYAGEIPWSPAFGSDFRTTQGTAKRHFASLMEYHDGSRWRHSGRVEIPVHRWVWESYHSSLNDVSGIEFPAPALCEHLSLVNHADTFDLWDASGRRASMYRAFDVQDWNTRSGLLYFRKDLLERYLAHTSQTLVWVAWGERTLGHKLFGIGQELPADVATAFQSRQNDFRELIEYEALCTGGSGLVGTH